MNALVRESSQYLRDHAGNPVNWLPWTEETWQRARTEDKPVFLSIGYSSCHWCHVMARESFENEEIARILNENFISIKVDREEHPEVDEVYVDAVRLLCGSAGWPLSVFLTPDLVPFYGGTYFPPEPRHGLPSFRQVLESVLHHYRAERGEIDVAGRTVVEELERLSRPEVHDAEIGPEPLGRFYSHHLERFDRAHGGFGPAPKFPEPTGLSLLLLLGGQPGFEKALPMAGHTLRKMAEGGIHDQLAGGFHRYSTDSVWLVPHFEKMLYDNALLSRAYTLAFQKTRDGFCRRVAENTLAWLGRELRSPDGGFFSSLDADTGEDEGIFYTWTRPELESALGRRLAGIAADMYGVTEHGNFHGRNVLHVAAPAEALHARHAVPADEFELLAADIRSKLLAVRSRRERPRTDEKLLADWNGLALSAFARAYQAFGAAELLETATSLARFIELRLTDGDDLLHVRRESLPDLPGQLADYAFVGEGMLDLYEASSDIQYLKTALGLTDRVLELFADPEGGFFSTAAGAPGLVTRARSGFDGAIPSGGSVACSNLLRLARLTGRTDYERAGALWVRRLYPAMRDHPQAFSRMLANLDFLLHPGTELALFLPEAAAEADRFLELVRQYPDPYRLTVVVRGAGPDSETARLVPLVRNRRALDCGPTAFVCRNATCLAPVKHTEDLERTLQTPGLLDTQAHRA